MLGSSVAWKHIAKPITSHQGLSERAWKSRGLLAGLLATGFSTQVSQQALGSDFPRFATKIQHAAHAAHAGSVGSGGRRLSTLVGAEASTFAHLAPNHKPLDSK